jgi:hypothetical protein
MSPEDLRELLASWFSGRSVTGVSFHEVIPTSYDSNDDYKVVYEAVFEPQSLEKARIEIWLTEEGRLALGFETRRRVATRLGLANWRNGFASGHEPGVVTPEGLLALLTVAAEGKIMLQLKTVFGVLGRISAAMTKGDRRILEAAGYAHVSWISIVKDRSARSGFPRLERLVRYWPW